MGIRAIVATGEHGDSEAALRHCTDTETGSNHVDTHGASVVGFAFTELLNFRLPPRLKNIGSIRLYRPDDTLPGWPTLGASLTRPIRWELIEQQYDQIVKSHWMPVCRTKRIPHSACRSGTRGLPSTSFGVGSGSNGSISDHSSSDTIHGRD